MTLDELIKKLKAAKEKVGGSVEVERESDSDILEETMIETVDVRGRKHFRVILR